jgi:centromere/kinetochore protein ZW10
MDRLFIMPRLGTQQGKIPTITIEGADQETIKVVNYNNDLRAARLFTDLRTIIEFLNDRLPAALMSKLSKILIPNLTSRLISTRLSLSIPSTLDDLPGFEELLEETKRFEDVIYRKEWTRERELSDWVDRAPKVWLAKRRETSIDTTRKILAAGIGKVEIVERSETQTVEVTASEEALVSGIAEASGADEWNATANKQEDEKMPDARPVKEEEKPAEPAGFLQDDEDDDAVDGWGLDEDIDMDDQPVEELEKKPELKPESTAESTAEPTAAAEPSAEEPENEDALPDDDEMDWGAWGDDDDELSVGVPSTTATNPRKKSMSESKKPEAAKEISTSKEPVAPKNTTTFPETVKSQEITLTENYTITAIPTALISLISRLLSEANDLQTNPKYASSPIAPAGKGILTISTLILATFRALAPLHYTDGLKSYMYLYNDCTYLSSNLPGDISEKDTSQILTFGKRHYLQEMEAQRAIFLDYLDGAQGFAGCTSDALQRQECDAAIGSTIYRLREIHSTWSTVLSKSALFQSIGMLLNTIVTKLVNDIEDLSDISEPESVRLAKYCGDIMGLEEELFMKVGMAQIYCTTWTKFVFVRRILESSMVQIMGMVRDDGILKNVLTAEEIVELVKALFAESEIRKQCIDYVRRGGH